MAEQTSILKIYRDKWQTGKIATPSDIQPDGDTNVWARQWAEYGFAQFCADLCRISSDGNLSWGGEDVEGNMAELELYGRGQQPIAKYKPMVDWSKKTPQGQELNILNISWRTLKIYPALRERVIDRLMKISYEPSAIALDGPSNTEKKQKYLKDRLATDPQSKAMFQQIGVEPDTHAEMIGAMTPTDIDVLDALGGYALQAEIEIRAVIEGTLELSNFEPTIRRQVIENLIDFGLGAVHIKHDRATMRQVVEYINPKNLVFRCGDNDDARDMDLGGFISYKSISQLRHESNLSEEELLQIAKSARNAYGNEKYRIHWPETYATIGGRNPQRNTGDCKWDHFRIPVFTMYWIALDVERHVVGIHKNGSKIFDPVRRDSDLRDDDVKKGKSVLDSTTQYVYRVCWPIGTQYTYNVGKDDITVRDGAPGDMKAMLPIVVYQSNRPSLTATVIPVIDDLQLAVYRTRAVRAKMPPPPNIAIDVSKMEDAITLGNMDIGIEDILDIYSVRGILMYHSRGEFNDPNTTQARPVFELPNTMFQYLQALQIDIENSLNMLRLVTGTNELSDGTANPQDVLNKVAAGYDESANRSLSFLYTANQAIFKNMCLQISRRYQAVAAKGGATIKYIPARSNTMRVIELSSDLAMKDFDIVIKLAIDDQTRQMVMQSLGQNKQQNTISESDYLAVSNMLARGEVMQAQFYLAKAVEQERERVQAVTNESMRVQAQAQTESAMAIDDNKVKTTMMEAESKGKLLRLEYDLKDKNAKNEHEWRMEELTLGNQQKLVADSVMTE